MIRNRVRSVARARVIVPLLSLFVGSSLVLTASGETSQAVPSNAAAGSCTLTMPAKLAIGGPYKEVLPTRGADCTAAGVVDARWEARNSNGEPRAQLIFRWDYPDTWNVFDSDPLQVWSWQPTGATTAGDVTLAKGTDGESRSAEAATVPQNTPTTDVRLASFTDLVVYQPDANGNMPFWVHGFRYSITPADLIPWGAAPGAIQYRPIGGTTWTTLKSFTTDASGQATHYIKWPGKREYRAVIYDSPLVYGTISPIETQ